MIDPRNAALLNNEDAFECEGCGEVREGEGIDRLLRAGTFEEPPEYVTICDECDAYDCEPPDDYDCGYDDPALDYAYDPYRGY